MDFMAKTPEKLQYAISVHVSTPTTSINALFHYSPLDDAIFSGYCYCITHNFSFMKLDFYSCLKTFDRWIPIKRTFWPPTILMSQSNSALYLEGEINTYPENDMGNIEEPRSKDLGNVVQVINIKREQIIINGIYCVFDWEVFWGI